MAFNPLAAKRFFELVRRVLGEDLTFESTSPEMQLAKILDLDPPEDWIWKGVLPWSSQASIAANPANVGRMQLTNQVGSGRIVVVQGMGQFAKPTVGFCRVTGDAAVAGGGTSPANGLDTRIPLDVTGVLGVTPPQNNVSNANAVISGFMIDRFTNQNVANTDTYSRVLPVRPHILTPGHNITIFNETLNEAALFIAWGYTREARPEELQPK